MLAMSIPDCRSFKVSPKVSHDVGREGFLDDVFHSSVSRDAFISRILGGFGAFANTLPRTLRAI